MLSACSTLIKDRFIAFFDSMEVRVVFVYYPEIVGCSNVEDFFRIDPAFSLELIPNSKKPVL